MTQARRPTPLGTHGFGSGLLYTLGKGTPAAQTLAAACGTVVSMCLTQRSRPSHTAPRPSHTAFPHGLPARPQVEMAVQQLLEMGDPDAPPPTDAMLAGNIDSDEELAMQLFRQFADEMGPQLGVRYARDTHEIHTRWGPNSGRCVDHEAKVPEG